jgi:polyhydroxybutyrate depolymerase
MVVLTTACTTATPSTTSDVSPRVRNTDVENTGEIVWSQSSEPCVGAGESGSCLIESYPDRPYDVFLPSSYDSGVAMPLVLAFHGGGGSSDNGATMSCPENDITDARCLHGLGEHEGFVTVYPNGTGFFPLKRLRTWNAGGGSEGWNCASGKACANKIDDLEYVDLLLEDLGTWLNIDRRRIYATGLSNGAAFSHRLACERAGTFAAIAAVAGSNQFSTGTSCDPVQGIGVLQIHGTEDPCWSYETTDDRCLGNGGSKLGALQSTRGWVDVLACDVTPIETAFPDTVDDATTTVATRWSGCDSDVGVLLLTVVGGGHTWPSGSPALPESVVGRITLDWGSEVLWDFLSSHSRVDLNG